MGSVIVVIRIALLAAKILFLELYVIFIVQTVNAVNRTYN